MFLKGIFDQVALDVKPEVSLLLEWLYTCYSLLTDFRLLSRNETDVTMNEGYLTVDYDVVDEVLGGILRDYYFRLLHHFRVL